MPLSPEDNLRLNVLLRQDLEAVRIDDSKMTVYALTGKGEAKVALNPNTRDEAYLKEVRQLFSSHVLGSPGGYPVFLQRWTRMGQARSDASLKRLLLLGENEAVVAVVHAPVLTDELARRAWWIAPNAENARRMLEKKTIANGAMGTVLAQFLVEFLPFETDPQDMIDSVRLVLQPGLISVEQRLALWHRGQRKASYQIGFLLGQPDDLPSWRQFDALHAAEVNRLEPLVESGNRLACLLRRLSSANGQAFISTCRQVIKKLNNQDTAVAFFQAIERYFDGLHDAPARQHDIDIVIDEADVKRSGLPCVVQVLNRVPELSAAIDAALILSMVSERLLIPVFSQTDAIGSVMRKKLAPVTSVIDEQLKLLQK